MPQTIIDPWVALVWKIVRPISRSSGLPVDRISSIPHQDGWSVRVEWPLLAYVLDVYSSPDRTVTDARASMLRKLVAKESKR